MACANDKTDNCIKLYEKIRDAELSLDILLDPFASDPILMMAARADPMAFMFRLPPEAAAYLAIQIAAPPGVLVKLSADLVLAKLSASAASTVPRTTDLGAGAVGLVTKNTYRRRLVVSFCLDPTDSALANSALESYRKNMHDTIQQIYARCSGLQRANTTFTMYQPRIVMDEIPIKIVEQAVQNNTLDQSANVAELRYVANQSCRHFLGSAMFEYLPKLNRLRVTHTNIEMFSQVMIDDIVFLMLGEYLYVNLADFGIVRNSEFKTDWALRPISGMYEQIAKHLAPKHCSSCGLHEHNVDLREYQDAFRCSDCIRYVDV